MNKDDINKIADKFVFDNGNLPFVDHWSFKQGIYFMLNDEKPHTNMSEEQYAKKLLLQYNSVGKEYALIDIQNTIDAVRKNYVMREFYEKVKQIIEKK